MISKFFGQQTDYALFIYGLGLILLAIICLILYQSKKRELPWIWLVGFAVFHGIAQWMDGLAYSFGVNAVFSAMRVLVITISLICLFEFGRVSIGVVTGRRIGAWVYIPALALLAAGALFGLGRVGTTSRYVLGILGGGGSAYALLASEKKLNSRYLSFSGLLILVYSILDCFSARPATAGPGAVINQDSFLRLTGFPIQLLCAGLIFGLAYALWEYKQSLKPPLSAKDRKDLHKMEWTFVLSAAAILALGWLAAKYVGDQADQALRGDIRNHVQIVESSINSQKLQNLAGLVSDQNLPDYIYLHDKLNELRKNDTRISELYLLKIKNGKIIFSVDTDNPADPDFKLPGSLYLEAPLKLFTIFFDGIPQIVGPYTNHTGTVISSFTAIRDEQTNQIIGVVGLDIQASYVQQAQYRERLVVFFLTLLVFLVLVEFSLFRQDTWENAIRIATSEKRLAEAQTIARIGSWSGRGADNPMTWSDEMFHIMGLAPENGAPTFNEFRKMIHPDDRDSFEQALNQAIQSHGNFEIEARVVRPDSRIAHIYVRGTARHSAQYDALLLVGILQDISEQKQAEQALRESEAHFRSVVQTAKDAIITINGEGKIIDWNQGAQSIFQYSEAEILGQTLERLMPRRYHSHHQNGLGRLGKGGEAHILGQTVEIYGLRKDGTEFPIELVLSSYCAERGVYFSGIIRDISEREQAERQLRKLSEVIEQSPISVVITSPEGAIEYVNPKFSDLTGYSQEEALGNNPRILKSGETPPEEYTRLWNTIRSGGTWNGNFHNKKKNGDLYWESASIFPIQTDLGEITNFVAVKEDITERVRAEDSLLRAHAELEQANAELEQASLVKSQFLANMSHEIRTPLNAIIGMTGLLMDTCLDDEQRNFAETVRTSGEVLLGLINDILDFSKIEAQKMELENQSFALRGCIEESLDLTVTRASEKKIELAYLIERDLPQSFFGDVSRLRQILVNLLGNAVKFTEQGEVVISVSGQMRDEHQYLLHFSVHDTGIGIPPERVSRLFQSFSQVDASTTRKYGGTGLGLAISKRLCEMMGGSMWVESTGVVGEGSTFHFTILVTEDLEQKQLEANSPALPLNGSRVLVVDDNKTNREILMHYTQSWKMNPCLASSGQEALDLLNSGAAFDLAIVDMQMPGMDGLRLASEIQTRLKEKAFPLILLSSLGYHKNKDEEASFAAYLTKPIKPSQLLDSIFAVVSQKEPVQKQKFAKTGGLFDREMGSRHPLRILLAEDNSVNQTVAQNLLGRLGYRMDIASNGVEALGALRRQPYDLVFMDGQMPEMDGIEATRRIREEWPADQQPWIVAMTANAMQGDRERYLKAGMDGYISKPIHMEELVKALGECQPLSVRARGGSEPKDGLETVHSGEGEAGFSAPQAVPQGGNCPAVDLKVLQDLQELMGDEGQEMVNNLVGLYLADAPALVGQMREAIVSGSTERLRLAAHTFKGNSSQLGMLPLSERCAVLEKLAKTGSMEGADGLLEAVLEEFERVRSSLKTAYPEASAPQAETKLLAGS